MSDQPNEMLVQDAPLENLPAIKQENPEASGDDTHSDRGSALYRVYANNLKEARRALKKGLQPSIAKQAGPSGSSKSLTQKKVNAPKDHLGKRKAVVHVDQVFAESQIVELLQKKEQFDAFNDGKCDAATFVEIEKTLTTADLKVKKSLCDTVSLAELTVEVKKGEHVTDAQINDVIAQFPVLKYLSQKSIKKRLRNARHNRMVREEGRGDQAEEEEEQPFTPANYSDCVVVKSSTERPKVNKVSLLAQELAAKYGVGNPSSSERLFLEHFSKVLEAPKREVFLQEGTELANNAIADELLTSLKDGRPFKYKLDLIRDMSFNTSTGIYLEALESLNDPAQVATVSKDFVRSLQAVEMSTLLEYSYGLQTCQQAVQKMLDKGVITYQAQIPKVLVMLLFSQCECRLVFIEELRRQAIDAENSRVQPNALTCLSKALKKTLSDPIWRLTPVQVGQIIAEPERLLHDECLNLLRTFKNPNVDKVVDIYILCKESKTATEFAEFKRVIEVFGRVPVIIEPVLKSLRSERLSLKVLDKNLAVIAGKPTRQILELIQVHGIKKQMELSEKLTKQRRAITDDIKNKVNDACVTSVKANSCYESFQKVEILSKECQKLNQGYHHDAFLCMLAAEGLSGIANNSKMTYIQADPGTGKSFAILLLAIALEKASFPAIVVTHNGTVKKHLLALKELLVPSRITIIEMSELPLQPKNGKLLIIDEFPQVFFSEKVAFDDHYELPWLLANAHNWQIIAFSAHQSYDWSQFLDKSFKNSKEFVNGSQFTMIGQQQEAEYHVVCCEAQNQSKEVVRIAEDLCHESPVIVFAEKKMVLEFTAKSADLWQKRPVDALSYKEAQRQIASKDRGILVLDFGESIGADPRFQVDAKVVMANKEKFRTEDILQAVARGCRSLGKKVGYVVQVAPEKDRVDLENALLLQPDLELQDAAQIYRVLREIKAFEIPNVSTRNYLNASLRKGLRQDWGEFQASLKNSAKNLLTTTMKKIQKAEEAADRGQEPPQLQ